jgi:hypothetical protein
MLDVRLVNFEALSARRKVIFILEEKIGELQNTPAQGDFQMAVTFIIDGLSEILKIFRLVFFKAEKPVFEKHWTDAALKTALLTHAFRNDHNQRLIEIAMNEIYMEVKNGVH